MSDQEIIAEVLKRLVKVCTHLYTVVNRIEKCNHPSSELDKELLQVKEILDSLIIKYE